MRYIPGVEGTPAFIYSGSHFPTFTTLESINFLKKMESNGENAQKFNVNNRVQHD